MYQHGPLKHDRSRGSFLGYDSAIKMPSPQSVYVQAAMMRAQGRPLLLQILYGNLAPEGCVAKITGKEGLVFEGPAKVYDSEEDMLAALSENPAALKVRCISFLSFIQSFSYCMLSNSKH